MEIIQSLAPSLIFIYLMIASFSLPIFIILWIRVKRKRGKNSEFQIGYDKGYKDGYREAYKDCEEENYDGFSQ